MVIQRIWWWMWNQMFWFAFLYALSKRMNFNDIKLDLREYKYNLDSEFPRPYILENIFWIKLPLAEDNEIPWYYRNEENYKIKNPFYKRLYTILVAICYPLTQHHFKENPYDSLAFFLVWKCWLSKLPEFLRWNLVFNKKLKYCKDRKWYFEWVFCSEKYFLDYGEQIREIFTFKKKLNKKSEELKKFINSNDCISVHIRRWDYLKNNNSSLQSIANIEYYNKAYYKIKQLYPDKDFHYIFFSDDIVRCKKSFKNKNSIFVDWNNDNDSWQDMALMSYCKHNIIANSTFSRRGARLNKNKNKTVIAPKIYQQWQPHLLMRLYLQNELNYNLFL